MRKLASLPKSINDRLMTLRLPLANKQHTTIISAPSTGSERTVLQGSGQTDQVCSTAGKIFLLGDFNAGTGHTTWEGVLGNNGVGKCNSNGLLLLRTCAEHKLIIMDTAFRLPHRNRTSLMHQRSRHWHLIEFVITRRKDRQDVRVTKAMCGADCLTDHRLNQPGRFVWRN